MKLFVTALLALVALAASTNAAVVCPPIGSDDLVVHVPNPDDCSSFYKCGYDGIPVLHLCPPGLEYNAALGVCDWPASAGCSSRDVHH